MQIRPCLFAGAQRVGAPQLRLVQGLDATDRDRARGQARAALRACLAPELGCAETELEIGNLRNQAPSLRLRGKPLAAPHCSISHAPGLALLAWHGRGALGVDIQAVDAAAPRREFEDVARLFLKPETAQALLDIAPDTLFFEAFASAWTQHEARLKCAGLGLAEWSVERQARLAGMDCAQLAPAAGYAGAVAWYGGGAR
ncbi:4'-phosphopantetheinyl transferase family protein [Comamonas guangdongensis]|uniref:4'-phosphopantetheinyl transferase superfamily protein n=1 Tax=Comamonas guangdongensis TaxID=510515 RepID=A0ABV3ZYM0_9BURK